MATPPPRKRRITVSLRVQEDRLAALDERASVSGVTRSALIQMAIDQFLSGRYEQRPRNESERRRPETER